MNFTKNPKKDRDNKGPDNITDYWLRLVTSLAGSYETRKLELQGAWEPPGMSRGCFTTRN